jgi:hypothetical protein
MEANIGMKVNAKAQIAVLPGPSIGEAREDAPVGTELRQALKAEGTGDLLQTKFGSSAGAFRVPDNQRVLFRVNRRAGCDARGIYRCSEKENAAPKPDGGAAFSN